MEARSPIPASGGRRGRREETGGWVAAALVNHGDLPGDVKAADAFYVATEFLSTPGVFGLVLAALTAALKWLAPKLKQAWTVWLTSHSAGGQALLFLNRRGFAPTLICCLAVSTHHFPQAPPYAPTFFSSALRADARIIFPVFSTHHFP